MYFYKLNGDEALQKIGVEELKSLGISKWQNQFKDEPAVMVIESFANHFWLLNQKTAVPLCLLA